MSDSDSTPAPRTRSRSRSRPTSRPASVNRPDQPSSNATAGAATTDANASESEDEDWDPEGEDEGEDDEDGDESVVTDASDAAAVFATILRRIGGDAVAGAVNASNIGEVLQQLAARGLLQQDEDGNLVMTAGDDDIEAMSEGEEGEDDGRVEEVTDDGESAMEQAESPAVEEVKDEEGLRDYARYTGLDRKYPTNVLQNIESTQRTFHVRPASSTQYSALSANQIPGGSKSFTTVERFEGRAFCGKFSHGTAETQSMFATATQDGQIHLFETDSWKLYK
jgi:hypothetical protein